MCGIIGYSGKDNAVEILLKGLERLEYRGYDSAGIACFSRGSVRIIKSEGRIENTKKLCEEEKISSLCGIGHTRWATHGRVSALNSHPHKKGRTTLVHNGIIENFAELKSRLLPKYDFVSETDSEIACALIDSFYSEYNDPVEALEAARECLKGSFAFAVIFEDRTSSVYAMRKESPLVVFCDEHGAYISSDVAVTAEKKRYWRISEEIAVIEKGRVKFFVEGHRVAPESSYTENEFDIADKEGFGHFMLKEIFEEPKVIQKTLSAYINNSMISFEFDDILSKITCVRMIGCGTALHAGKVGSYFVEGIAGVPCRCDIASEFRYNAPERMEGELVIVLSQSGETADSLAALRKAKKSGALTLAVVNVSESSIARESDMVIYTKAGPEIAVASTKAYSAQLCLLYLFAFRLAYKRKRLSPKEMSNLCRVMYSEIPDMIQRVTASKESIERTAELYSKYENMFFIGRGLDYLISEEASLKLKEISYIHSEAYPAGELKHGTISLITEDVPVVAFIGDTQLSSKTESNVKEVRSRGARVLLFCTEETKNVECDDRIILPYTDPLFYPFGFAAAFQLFAYYVAYHRGCDIDKPRNLAKSVTVE